jgi:hypothetical protein
MSKESFLHKDALGRELKIGNCVAYPISNALVVGIVHKISPKMIGVTEVGNSTRNSKKNKYPKDCVLLDGPEVTLFLIKNSSSSTNS